MKFLLSTLGAIIGAAVAIFYVAQPVSTNIMQMQSFDSPSQVEGMTALVYLLVLGGMLVLGYLIGMGLGHLIERVRGTSSSDI